MSRGITFTLAAWDDDVYLQGQDRKSLKRIYTRIGAARRDPFQGIGKPDAAGQPERVLATAH